MTDNIFESADQPTTETTTNISQPQPEIPPELTELVGVGKKYSNLNEVYKAFPHAQQHIANLEEENKKIKEELEKRKSAEEVLADLQQNFTTNQPETKQVMPDISSLVRKELEKVATETQSKQNQNQVVTEFNTRFGEKAQEQFNKLAAELNVSVSNLNQLAATSPKALFKLAGFDLQVQQTKSGSIQSDVRNISTTSQQEEDPFKVSLNGGAKEDAIAIAKAREMIKKQYNL